MSKSMARKVWKLLENDLQLCKLEHCQVSKFYIVNITDLILETEDVERESGQLNHF